MSLTMSPQPELREQLRALTSADEGERRVAITHWRSCTDPRAFTAVADKLLDVVKPAGPKATLAADTLLALGDSVLPRILHHFVRSRIPAARVRLLELLARIPPVADRSRALDLETTLLTLCHAEREPAVQAAFGPALFQHAPTVRYAALSAAEERLRPGEEDWLASDDPEESDQG